MDGYSEVHEYQNDMRFDQFNIFDLTEQKFDTQSCVFQQVVDSNNEKFCFSRAEKPRKEMYYSLVRFTGI